jgi:hypothetical protein
LAVARIAHVQTLPNFDILAPEPCVCASFEHDHT